MNLHNPDEFDGLVRQRIACGWNYDRKTIEGWRKAMDEKTKPMFWIVAPPSPSAIIEYLSEKPKRQGPYLGHIALQSVLEPPELDLADPDKSLMMLSTFFILPEHRYGGLGRAAVQAAEAYARMEPYGSLACKALTLTTLSRQYAEDDGEEWRGSYAKRGLEPPEKGRSIEDWYLRMGYVKFKEAPRYREMTLDGTEIMLVASFLRKEFV